MAPSGHRTKWLLVVERKNGCWEGEILYCTCGVGNTKGVRDALRWCINCHCFMEAFLVSVGTVGVGVPLVVEVP